MFERFTHSVTLYTVFYHSEQQSLLKKVIYINFANVVRFQQNDDVKLPKTKLRFLIKVCGPD